jgi:hypothetical protein
VSRLRSWAPALLVYLATRVVAAAFILRTAPHRRVHLEHVPGYHSVFPHDLPVGYREVVTSWDAQWYLDIALHGYPDSPLGPTGEPVQTSLAFFPLYPLVVRTLMALTGLPFDVVAPVFSALCGAAAAVVVFVLVSEVLDRRRALICVALLFSFASAPVFQVAYTESLGLLLVATALLLIRRGRLLAATLPVVLLGFTRNLAPVLVFVVVACWVVAEVRARRSGTRPPRWRFAVLGASALGASVAWPATVAVLTGDADAYTTTLSAWPGFTGSLLRPPWLAALSDSSAATVVVSLFFIGGFATVLASRSARAWGVELWSWTVGLLLFVVATTSATTSIVRYLVLAFPLGLVLTPPADNERTRRVQDLVVLAACALGLATQYVWVDKLLVFGGPDGGWGFP